MSVFDPTDAHDDGLLDAVGDVVTAPARWVGDSLGALIGGIGGGVVDAVATPVLWLAGMLLATLVLITVV